MKHLLIVVSVAAMVALSCCQSYGATITAKKEANSVIKVVVPGVFETNVTKRKGFVGNFWDLKNDPQKKRDLGPVLDENGILWTKVKYPNHLEGSDASWYAAPSDNLELLESGPARVRIRISGVHSQYGKTSPSARWEELPFEQTFTMYPTGHVYVEYKLTNKNPIEIHQFRLIIKSNGSWGKSGVGEGANEVRHAGEFGPKKPSQWTKPLSLSSFALQWSNGPTYFQDFLMVMYKGRYGGTYWDEGFEDKDIRTGLDLMSRWPDGMIAAGGDRILLLFRFGHGMNRYEVAKLYSQDYRSPDRLEVTEGVLVTDDPGDLDNDGFAELEGCYVLKVTGSGVELTIHGAKTPRMQPAFKVLDWKDDAPGVVKLGEAELEAGTGFNASVADGVLILQILEIVKSDVKLLIPAK